MMLFDIKKNYVQLCNCANIYWLGRKSLVYEPQDVSSKLCQLKSPKLMKLNNYYDIKQTS